MSFLYNAAIALYGVGISCASYFNPKAKLWVEGRNDIFEKLSDTFKNAANRPVWIHCASLGEYEQARPLIEKIKSEQPDSKVFVTFFSPSGYENAVKKSPADFVFYLPLDTQKNAERFVEIVKPKAAIFVKYEFWYNYIQILSQKNVPFYFISAIFRDNQYFFKPYGKWFVNKLKLADHFFVQNEKSKNLLESVGIKQVTLCGDTRFDRVVKIAETAEEIPFMENFSENCPVIVAGSSWAPDETLLAQLLSDSDNYKLVVAPHEISRADDVAQIFSNFKTTSLSQCKEEDLRNFRVLIVDSVGILNKLYKYSRISYVGGAFKTGLHNILEAAVYGKPVFFGPDYSRFDEAVRLVALKGAFSISNYGEMLEKLNQFDENCDYYSETCKICRDFVRENSGACDLIYEQLKNNVK